MFGTKWAQQAANGPVWMPQGPKHHRVIHFWGQLYKLPCSLAVAVARARRRPGRARVFPFLCSQAKITCFSELIGKEKIYKYGFAGKMFIFW